MGIIHLPAGKTALASACGERFDPQQVCVADGPVTWEFTLVSNNAQYALWASTCANTTPGELGVCGTAGGSRDSNGPDIDNQTLNAQLYCWGALNESNNSVRSYVYSGGAAFTITSITLSGTTTVGAGSGPNFLFQGTLPLQNFNPPTGVGSLPAYESPSVGDNIGLTIDVPWVQFRITDGGGLQLFTPTQVGLYDAVSENPEFYVNGSADGFVPRPIGRTYDAFAETYTVRPGDRLEFRFFSTGFETSNEVPQVQLGDIDVTVTGFVA